MSDKNCEEADDFQDGFDSETTLSVRQQRGLAALVANPTASDAAAASGIGESTLRRWLNNENFRAALHRAGRELLAHTVAHAGLSGANAVKILETIAADANSPATARVQAARYLDQRSTRLLEFGDFARRLEELEELYKSSVAGRRE